MKNIFTLPVKPIFPKGNPVGKVVSLSVGISKDFILMAGADNYIRVFEYSAGQNANELMG